MNDKVALILVAMGLGITAMVCETAAYLAYVFVTHGDGTFLAAYGTAIGATLGAVGVWIKLAWGKK